MELVSSRKYKESTKSLRFCVFADEEEIKDKSSIFCPKTSLFDLNKLSIISGATILI